VTTTTTTIALPEAGSGWREIDLREPRAWAEHPQPFQSRIAFAAAHVVADPRGENVPGAPAAVDWEATLGFRRHLFRYGLGVAEAMDTSQVKVADYAGDEVVTIGADDDIEEALATMARAGVRRLPVIDGHDLVGMISQADIATHLPEDKVGDLVEAISSAPSNS